MRTYHECRYGGDQHEPAPVFQVFVGLLCHDELRFHVDGEDPVNLLFRDFLELAEMLDARVAHDNVNPPELGLGRLEQACDLAAPRDIRLDSDSLHARLPDSRSYLLGSSCRRNIVYHDVSTVRGELLYDCGADTTARARHSQEVSGDSGVGVEENK